MVHVEHTSVASRAVMASLWLKNIAHQAVSTPLILIVAEMEAPEDGHLSRVRRHTLEEGPHEHDK
jgi:hypothetical protein